MSDDPIDPEQYDGGEVDPGEPIKELAGFEHDVSTTLLNRIHRAIGRRTTAAQVTTFALDMPFAVLKEFWLALVESLGSKQTRKDGRR